MKHILYLLTALTLICSSCSKDATKLKIRVVSTEIDSIIVGATVKLYDTRTNWLNENDPIAIALTNDLGEVTFKASPGLNYFFSVSYTYQDETYSNYPFSIIGTSEPLHESEQTLMTVCIYPESWIDFNDGDEDEDEDEDEDTTVSPQ